MVNIKNLYIFCGLVVFAVIMGELIGFIIGKPYLSIRGLLLFVPSISAVLVLINMAKVGTLKENFLVQSINNNCCYVIFCMFFIFSILSLSCSHDRSHVFCAFFLLAVVSLLFMVLLKNISNKLFLFCTIALLSTFISSVVFKYAFYFGTTDVIGHISLIKMLIADGHLFSENVCIYYHAFPLYHILHTIAICITAMDAKESVFLVNLLIFLITPIITLIIMIKSGVEQRLAQLTVLIGSFATVNLFKGLEFVPRAYVFVGLLFLLYLIIFRSKMQDKIIAMIVIAWIVLGHQVSSAQFLAIMVLLIIIERIVHKKIYFKPSHVILFAVAFTTIWIYNAINLFEKVLIQNMDSGEILTHLTVKGSVGQGEAYRFIVENLDKGLALFFVVIGAGIVISKHFKGYQKVFGILGIFGMLFWFPNPIYMFMETAKLLRVDRLAYVFTPFVAYLLSVGILVSLKFRKNFIIILSSILIIFFIISPVVASDFDKLWPNESRKYFTNGELVGISFIDKYVPINSNIYSDYPVTRYFRFDFIKTDNHYDLAYRRRLFAEDDGQPGYRFIRNKELNEHGLEVANYYSGVDKIYSYSELPYVNKIIYDSNIVKISN
ncbi:MAG: hypothetical protein K9L17_08890 [Clostridiales bacterium]|nr:hypothetical protein [Clostridiales bacterium]MCF8022793.1 hypothetical protein [Clostridiales bacterium]